MKDEFISANPYTLAWFLTYLLNFEALINTNNIKQDFSP